MSSTLMPATRLEPQPPVVMDRLFLRLMAFYGMKFADSFMAVELAAMKRIWSEELAGYSLDELNRGINACRGLKWPPTLPEFMGLCRPLLEPEVAFHEAATKLALRDRGDDPAWSHPAVYWAAVEIGHWDIRRLGYQPLKARWAHALREQMARTDLAPVPPPLRTLPACGGRPPSPEVAEQLKRLTAQLRGTLAAPKDAA